jgi:alpha-1,2-mannosyltransferase
MISAVRLGRPSVNNRRPITAISSLKLVYYRCFALLYAKVGGYAECVMVNSSWTLGHIKEIWATDKCAIVYPPCDVCALSQLPDEKHESGDEAFILVSVAQFRPEKDHQLQLEAFAEFRRRHPSAKARLLLIGGARNFQDRKRVSELQQFAKDYGLTTSVEFLINVDYEQLKNYLGSAVIGLHTMWNEHFGIGIVEYLAAGVIPIAHRSGGPRLDIIKPFHNQPVGNHKHTNLIHQVTMYKQDYWQRQNKNMRLPLNRLLTE